MRLGLFCLLMAYGLSQFYRAFLAVMSPALAQDIGASADDLATASGVWFLVFAAMQIPVGTALDRFGPKRTAVVLFSVGAAGGAFAFSMATQPIHLTFAMGLIGAGCAPVLMASYFIFARMYPAAVFATLASAMVGFGSLGNLASAAPIAYAVASVGWRGTMVGLALLTLSVAFALWLFVKDPPRVNSDQRGSFFELLKMPVLWPIFAMMVVNYAPVAAIRGLWIGPFAVDVYGASVATIGQITLVMGIAMILGSFAYGPLDRVFGTRKWVILLGNVVVVAALVLLWGFADRGLWLATALFAVMGFAGATFAVVIAHGKAFLPAHLTGRGVSLLNLFGIGGVGLMQFATGGIFVRAQDMLGSAAAAHGILFLFFAALVTIGLIFYAFSQDSVD